jgi:hypothetical protein
MRGTHALGYMHKRSRTWGNNLLTVFLFSIENRKKVKAIQKRIWPPDLGALVKKDRVNCKRRRGGNAHSGCRFLTNQYTAETQDCAKCHRRESRSPDTGFKRRWQPIQLQKRADSHVIRGTHLKPKGFFKGRRDFHALVARTRERRLVQQRLLSVYNGALCASRSTVYSWTASQLPAGKEGKKTACGVQLRSATIHKSGTHLEPVDYTRSDLYSNGRIIMRSAMRRWRPITTVAFLTKSFTVAVLTFLIRSPTWALERRGHFLFNTFQIQLSSCCLRHYKRNWEPGRIKQFN